MSSEHYSERILKFIQAKEYRPQQMDELARALGIGGAEQGDFHAACKALMRTGRVVLGSRNTLALPGMPGRVVGVFRGNLRGFGFIVPDVANAHGDLFVPPGGTGTAITGDTVEATVKKRGKRGGKMLYEGKIVQVLKRGRSTFVGELRRQFNRWFVVPDGNVLHAPIVVDDPGAKRARAGDQVVVEITSYPDEAGTARGVIASVLGKRGEPGVDTKSIIIQYQLPESFEAAPLEAARKAVAEFDASRNAEGRNDLCKLTIITIDPDDARDFDDAISIDENADGTVELGVHIADVAHFVREGSALDSEARERANSVYLPDTVLPMLPELLSNGVCSLQEKQPRLTKSAFITYDKNGQVKKTRFANSIIRSTKRLTYRQAAAILDGKPGRIGAKVVALLQEMERLAKTIRQRRIREGMLVLDLPSAELVLDDDGRPVDVEPEDVSFPHTIIEMFMVEANEAVARLFHNLKVPCLRRIHGGPEASSAVNLRKFISMLGYELSDGTDRAAVQALLAQVSGTPGAFAVNLAVLRSMQQAEYSPRTVGHYALASKHYGHFTSPIRRYPDLTVHRLLDRYLQGALKTAKQKQSVPSDEDLTALGRHCSNQERHAEAAERELKLVLILRLLENQVGESFRGVVTGIANMGVFVQLDRYLVEGLLRFDRLLDDWWEVEAGGGVAIGERSGRQIKIGDCLKVIIGRIDLPNRQIELSLTDPLPPTTARCRTTKPTSKPGKSDAGGRRAKSSGSAPRGGGARRSGKRLTKRRRR